MQVLFFLNADLLSRKILVQAKFWIETRYQNLKSLMCVCVCVFK